MILSFTDGEFHYNGRKLGLKFDIGLVRELGITDFEDYNECFKNTKKLIHTAKCAVDRALSAYGRRYNIAVTPVEEYDILETVVTLEDMRRLEFELRAMYKGALPISSVKFNEWTEDAEGRKIRPTPNVLLVMGTGVLGLTCEEVCAMTAKEICELLDAYNEINKREKKNISSWNTEGIGNAEAVFRLP